MDVIADMLTIIRNAQAVKKETVVIPHSKLKLEILKVLVREKFLKEAEVKGKKNKKIIDVILAYDEKKNPAINQIKRISKPSKRVYLAAKKIKSVKKGLGALIISTSKGILTDKEARKKRVGGETLCEIW